VLVPDRARRLAAAGIGRWLTSADNPYFARSYANRVWGYLTGVGIIRPIDDIRAGNPPSNPELLDYLTTEFVSSGFNVQSLMRLICHSRTYQLSVATNAWNADDRVNYAHAVARRLPAEVLFDAVHAATGAVPNIPGVPAGTRAVQLPDVGVTLPSGFLETLGRPVRESVCECERSNEIQLGPVMAMLSGPVVADAIADRPTRSPVLSLRSRRPAVGGRVVPALLNRRATEPELPIMHEILQKIDLDHQQLTSQLQAAEEAWTQQKQQRETTRLSSLADAQRALADYEQQIAPRVAELEQQRAERIQRAETALRDYEAQVQNHFDVWARSQLGVAEWHPLIATQLEASNGALLRSLSDRSIAPKGRPKRVSIR